MDEIYRVLNKDGLFIGSVNGTDGYNYIKDNKLNEFIGYCVYHYNKNEDRYECDILIEYKYRGNGYSKAALNLLCKEAKENGIDSLYDYFEIDRNNTLKVFESVGFKIVEEMNWEKFNKKVKGVLVKISFEQLNKEYVWKKIIKKIVG